MRRQVPGGCFDEACDVCWEDVEEVSTSTHPYFSEHVPRSELRKLKKLLEPHWETLLRLAEED